MLFICIWYLLCSDWYSVNYQAIILKFRTQKTSKDTWYSKSLNFLSMKVESLSKTFYFASLALNFLSSKFALNWFLTLSRASKSLKFCMQFFSWTFRPEWSILLQWQPANCNISAMLFLYSTLTFGTLTFYLISTTSSYSNSSFISSSFFSFFLNSTGLILICSSTGWDTLTVPSKTINNSSPESPCSMILVNANSFLTLILDRISFND